MASWEEKCVSLCDVLVLCMCAHVCVCVWAFSCIYSRCTSKCMTACDSVDLVLLTLSTVCVCLPLLFFFAQISPIPHIHRRVGHWPFIARIES